MIKQPRCLVCLLIIWMVISCPVWAENWPCFRGATRQGISREKNLPLHWSDTEHIAWKKVIPGVGWSSPIVYEDHVYLSTATEEGVSFRLLCLERKSGRVLWNQEVKRQKAGHKQGLNSYATPTPVTDGHIIYVLATDGSLTAVSREGEIQWTNEEVNFYGHHGLAVSPVLHDDLVIIAFDGSSSGPNNKVGWQIPWDQAVIMAYDKHTGAVRWRARRGLSRIAHVVPQPLTRNGKTELISAAGDVIQGFDIKTGARIWTARCSGEGVVPSVVIGDDLIFATTGFGDSEILAVRPGGRGDVTDSHIVWRVSKDVPHVPSFLYAQPHLYVLTEGGVISCLQAASGELVWRERLRGRYSASPVWAQGKIHFLSEKGVCTVIQAGPEFKVLATNDLKEKCCASPAISQGCIFIRSEKHLFCIR